MPDLPEIPAARTSTEIRVVNSRFIATLIPVERVEQAKTEIAAIRQAMPDANHHVYAFIIGHGASKTEGMSDDGEPSGTAGRPALAVLRGSGLGDVLVVVTRYFGGTLLGTGGLVHAYGDAVKAVLELTPRRAKIAMTSLLLTLPYPFYEQVRRLISHYEASIEDETFASDVSMIISLPATQATACAMGLRELTHGKASVEPL